MGAYYGKRASLGLDTLLTINFIKKVHQKMFGQTWRWAGEFRKSGKNIGVDWISISTKLYELFDDVHHQVKNHSYEIDEIGARLHHRLVAIHPFSNGNGRHARCITDLFLKILQQPVFSWGQKNLYRNTDFRKTYINTLKAADKHDYAALLDFVRK